MNDPDYIAIVDPENNYIGANVLTFNGVHAEENVPRVEIQRCFCLVPAGEVGMSFTPDITGQVRDCHFYGHPPHRWWELRGWARLLIAFLRFAWKTRPTDTPEGEHEPTQED